MKTLRLVLSELFGLFVDDWLLAVGIALVVILAALASYALHAPSVAGIILVAGCLIALATSTLSRR